MMIVHTRAMLVAPLLAIAVVVSSASAALLRPPFPPRGSGLLVRQDGEVKIPQECDPQCVPAINTVNVSTHPPHPLSPFAQLLSYTEPSRPRFVGLPHCRMRLYEIEHERVTRLHGVCRLGFS